MASLSVDSANLFLRRERAGLLVGSWSLHLRSRALVVLLGRLIGSGHGTSRHRAGRRTLTFSGANAIDVGIGINPSVLHAVAAGFVLSRYFSNAALLAAVKVRDPADVAKIQVKIVGGA